jgi:hypothetical protein
MVEQVHNSSYWKAEIGELGFETSPGKISKTLPQK